MVVKPKNRKKKALNKRKLSFENYIKQICTKASAKIKAQARVAPFVNKGKENYQ